MRYTYLLVDLLTVIVPLVFSFHPKIKFYKEWKAFIPANLLVLSIFILWDISFTNLDVWGFNSRYILGIYIFNLPLEEILFFICIPFACVFTYHCLTRFYKFSFTKRFEGIFIPLFSFILLNAGIYFFSRKYTSSVFISLSIILFLIKYLYKPDWLSKLFVIYLFLLIPFFIVNGILTGTGLEQPVVWYNDNENIGVRLFTIPLEDIFYGFELILLNIFFCHLFRSRSGMHIAL